MGIGKKVNNELICKVCGHELVCVSDVNSACAKCPVSKVTSCKPVGGYCCPNCGWKPPVETKLSKLVKKILGGE